MILDNRMTIDGVIREYWEWELPDIKERGIDLFREEDLINDIVGPRRAGKTYLMFWEIKQHPRRATIYINFEDRRLLPPTGEYFNDIIRFIWGERLLEQYGKVYLFLDEVQRMEGWERWVRSVYDEFKGRIKIFVSGSSSRLLSKEYAELLTGRHLTTVVTPLSFSEFLAFRGFKLREHPTEKEEALIQRYLKEYLTFGSFPEVVLSDDKEAIGSQLFTDIISRDIISRVDIRKHGVMEEFAYYLLNNVSNLLSFNKMANYFKSRGIKVSVPTLANYFGYMKNAFLFFDHTIYSYKIRDQFQYPRKVYCIDPGIANMLSSRDLGRVYENAVAVELLRRGRVGQKPGMGVHYWKSRYQEEVDFVVTDRSGVTQLIQVSLSGTEEREARALMKAMEEFGLAEGLVITGDLEGEEIKDDKKIIYTPLWKWLLGLS